MTEVLPATAPEEKPEPNAATPIARPGPAPTTPKKFSRRPWLIGGGSAAVILLLGGLVVLAAFFLVELLSSGPQAQAIVETDHAMVSTVARADLENEAEILTAPAR